jgi:hypothetical protein
LDQGSLTGTLTLESKWPEGDWRNSRFRADALKESVEHADALKPLVPPRRNAAGDGVAFHLE